MELLYYSIIVAISICLVMVILFLIAIFIGENHLTVMPLKDNKEDNEYRSECEKEYINYLDWLHRIIYLITANSIDIDACFLRSQHNKKVKLNKYHDAYVIEIHRDQEVEEISAEKLLTCFKEDMEPELFYEWFIEE
jgi:hypothetical protein